VLRCVIVFADILLITIFAVCVIAATTGAALQCPSIPLRCRFVFCCERQKYCRVVSIRKTGFVFVANGLCRLRSSCAWSTALYGRADLTTQSSRLFLLELSCVLFCAMLLLLTGRLRSLQDEQSLASKVVTNQRHTHTVLHTGTALVECERSN